MEERFKEAEKRYEGEGEINRDDKEFFIECAEKVEQQIFEHLDIRPSDINKKSVQPFLENFS